VNAAPADARASADDHRIRAFLAESLALWKVEAIIDATTPPGVAVIHAQSGMHIWVERAEPALPFRWWVRSGPVADLSQAHPLLRPRPCGSLVGLLTAIRSALGVERGRAVRVIPAPESE
jgi:hypothetical protein